MASAGAVYHRTNSDDSVATCFGGREGYEKFQRVAATAVANSSANATPDRVENFSEVCIGMVTVVLFSVILCFSIWAHYVSGWDWTRWPPWAFSADPLLESMSSSQLLQQTLTLSVTVEHLSHGALLAHAAGRGRFEAVVRRCVAGSVPGLAAEDVEVGLTPGSVVATCSISPRPGREADIAPWLLQLRASAGELQRRLSEELNAEPALRPISTGLLTVRRVEGPRLHVAPTFDGDGDGLVTPAEFCHGALQVRYPRTEAYAMQAFQVLDVDGDGRLNATELQSSSIRAAVARARTVEQVSAPSSTTTTTSSMSIAPTTRPLTASTTTAGATTSSTATTAGPGDAAGRSPRPAERPQAEVPSVAVVRASVAGLPWHALPGRRQRDIAATFAAALAHDVGVEGREVMDAAGKAGCISVAASGPRVEFIGCVPLPEGASRGAATEVFGGAALRTQVRRDLSAAAAFHGGAGAGTEVRTAFALRASCRSSEARASWSRSCWFPLAGNASSAPRTTTTAATTSAAAAPANAAWVVLRAGLPPDTPLKFRREQSAAAAAVFQKALSFAAGDWTGSTEDRACAAVAADAEAWSVASCLRLPHGARAADLQAVLTSTTEKEKLESDLREVLHVRLQRLRIHVHSEAECGPAQGRFRGPAWDVVCPATATAAGGARAGAGSSPGTAPAAAMTTTTAPATRSSSSSTVEPHAAWVQARVRNPRWEQLGRADRAAAAQVLLQDFAYAMGLETADISAAPGHPGCISLRFDGGLRGRTALLAEACVPLARGVKPSDVQAVFSSKAERSKVSKDLHAHGGAFPQATFTVLPTAACTETPSSAHWSGAGIESEVFCQEDAVQVPSAPSLASA